MIGNKRYYLIFLPPLFLTIILSALFNFSFLGLSIFVVAYCWRAIFLHPNSRDKINQHKNRFSFTKLISFYENKLLKATSSINIMSNNPLLGKMLATIIPVLIISIISNSLVLILWGALGALTPELINILILDKRKPID